MEKVKVLWLGDAVASTGFASVGMNVISNLPKKYEVHQLGVNYYGDPHPYKWYIYPAATGGDVYGIQRLENMVRAIKPDLIFIINDPWIINAYLEVLKKMDSKVPVVVYFPADAEEHSPKWFENFDIVKAVCVYNEFGKAVAINTKSPNVTASKVHVIPHGSDTKHFFPIPKEEAWKMIFPNTNIDQYLNSFVIFNGNRNQPRKRIDLTMWIFREFQRGKQDVKLYLHMGTTDTGVDIIELALRYGFPQKFIITDNVPSIPSVPIERLNVIYNSADVGINTSTGEGWGLVSWEQALCGIPQIVPYSSSLPYVWKNGTALFLDAPIPHMHPNINTVGRVPSIQSGIDMLEWCYQDWKNNSSQELKKIGQAGRELALSDEYNWKNISKEFAKVFDLVLTNDDKLA